MEIKRTIDGKEYTFELTSSEMFMAYNEQQHKYYVSDVQENFDEDCYIDDRKSDEQNEYALSLRNNPDFIEDVIDSYLGYHDIDWWENLTNAFYEVKKEWIDCKFKEGN